jgi:hypothetical protein
MSRIIPVNYIQAFYNSGNYTNFLKDWMLKDNWVIYKIKEIEELFKLEYIKDEDISTDKTIYCQFKNISQEKLRNSGFKIRRDIMASDLAMFDGDSVVNNVLKNSYYPTLIPGYIILNSKSDKIKEHAEFLIKAEDNFTLQFVKPMQLYPKVYKYEGNKVLADQIIELCNSDVADNIIIAMEMMSNANWDDNPIYVIEILTQYVGMFYVKCRAYFNSISFKGFTDYIQDKTGTSIHAIKCNTAEDYKPYCLTEEHHQYIYNKFKDEFTVELKGLCTKYKLTLTTFEVEIDKTLTDEDYDE